MLAIYNSRNYDEAPSIRKCLESFYTAQTLQERIEAMIAVRASYEATQLLWNRDNLPMDETITKVVGQFHNLSTTIVAEELGDNSQYLDKIMNSAWNIMINGDAGTVEELLASLQDDNS